MQLTERQKKHLRALAHNAKPVVTIADKGLSENVLKELESALKYHELIKVRVRVGDRDERDALLEKLCEECRCVLLKRVGHVATLFRRNAQKPKVVLPGSGRTVEKPS
ncbi:MAG: ribosome assembly RNA-binding protein YhbY [Gammaproteobacteria bacterium]